MAWSVQIFFSGLPSELERDGADIVPERLASLVPVMSGLVQKMDDLKP